MESPNCTNQEECFKYPSGEEGHSRTEALISQTSQIQTLALQDSKQRMEEELKTLLQETTLLRKELESTKTEIEKLKNKSAAQQNVTQQCKIEFELDLPNSEAKAEVMKFVGGLPDISSITLEGKRLSLKSIDIDPLALRDKMKKMCEVKLVRFYITEMKKEEKKEERKMDAAYPYPRGPPYPNPQMYGDNYGAATAMRMSYFRLKEAGTIFLAVFISFLLLRLAPDANVHVLTPSNA